MRSFCQKLILFLAIFWVPNAAFAEKMPYVLGAGVHHGDFLQSPIYDPTKTVDALREYRFESFRDTLGWSTFDREIHRKFPLALKSLKFVLDNTKDIGTPLLVFTSGDPTYNDGYLPTTILQRKQAMSFIKKSTIATKDYSPIYELWNEWNLCTGTRKKIHGTPEDYVAFVKLAYPVIKETAPESTVLVGGMATNVDPIPGLKREWVWAKKAIDLGMLKYGDAVSIHLYNICRNQSERRPYEAINRLEKLIKIIGKKTGNDKYPIYITETGWPEKIGGCGFTPEEQMSFSSQFLFWVTKYPSVKGVWIYELKDSGVGPDNIEHHFGFLDYNYRPKPMACVLRDVRNILSGASFHSERKVTNDNRIDFVMNKEDGTQFDLVWLPEKKGEPQYVVPEGKTARFVCSNYQFQEGMSVNLSELPLIVTDKRAEKHGG